MNQITQQNKNTGDLATLYPELSQKQMRAARLLAANVSISTIASSLNLAESIIASWLDDDKFMGAVSYLSARGSLVSQLMQEATVLSWMHIVDALSYEWASAPASAKAEMLKTARMIVQSAGDTPQSVNNNVGTVQMYVSGGSVDAIARRVTELQSNLQAKLVDDITTEYDIVSVDAQYSVHPETDIGTINYDEETNKYQCHVCGKWFGDLFDHAREVHGLKKEKYCEMYGIS